MKKMSLVLMIGLILSLFLNLLSCCSGKKITTATIIKSEIVATLRVKVKPQQVVSAFQKYKIETLKVINKDTNIWIFTFDKSLVDPDYFLDYLKDSQFIISAKFGKIYK